MMKYLFILIVSIKNVKNVKFLGQMLLKQYEYTPELDNEYKEGITALLQKENKIWIGREDGVLEHQNSGRVASLKVFKSDFDYLENEDIKPKIIAMEHIDDGGLNDIMFLGNEKSIKIIKIRNDASTSSIVEGKYSNSFRFEEIKFCKNIHNYVMNSISINKSKEYMISSDYIKINLWRPERMENFYTIIDLKPQLAEGSVFVINSCKFSQFKDNIMAYSTSNGEISLNDISITPKSQNVLTMKNFNTDSIKSISDFAFIDENILVSRSLNNICLFDIRNIKSSVFTKELISVPEEQNALNSSDAIYEKFKIAGDGIFAYTGSYFNTIYSINVLSGAHEEILVGPERNFNIESRTKLVSAFTNGFVCAINGTVYSMENI